MIKVIKGVALTMVMAVALNEPLVASTVLTHDQLVKRYVLSVKMATEWNINECRDFGDCSDYGDYEEDFDEYLTDKWKKENYIEMDLEYFMANYGDRLKYDQIK